MTTIQERVAKLNVAFGNPQGDLTSPNIAALRKQAILVLEEAIELVEATHQGKNVDYQLVDVPINVNTLPVDMAESMDAIGDLLTVVYGFGHVAGFNSDEVYGLVEASNYTKMVRNEEEGQKALSFYYGLGYPIGSIAIEGEFPTAIVRVLRDIVVEGKPVPKGKFLKNPVTFTLPNFYPLLPA